MSAGDQVSGHRLVSRIGRSALGELWSTDDHHVVELLPAGTEVSFAACDVEHAHLAKIDASGVDAKGHPFLVIANLRGEPLADVIARAGRLASSRVADIAGKVAAALDALHHAHHLHGALATAAIFVDKDEHVTVLDAGLVRAPSTGSALGYAAPEAFDKAAKLDARADIYALGAIAYEMASGRAPFVGATPAELPERHARTVPASLASIVPDVAKTLDMLVARMLHKTPEDRPRAAKELSFVFELVENNEVVPSFGSTIKQVD